MGKGVGYFIVLLLVFWCRVNIMILYNGLDSHQREVFRVEILIDKRPSDIIELGTIMEIGLSSMMVALLPIIDFG